MIWEQNTRTIVMLTNLKEGSKTKCHQYWPESKETYRDITVTTHKTEVFPDYVIRTFVLKQASSQETHNVHHFQFTVWPDKGVPQYATAVLALRRKVKAKNPDHAGPVVVHCSAGVGRTGAYIVIDAMLERAKMLKDVDIPNYMASIRNARPYMVQTDEQYVFIHLAIYEAFTCGNTEIQAFNLQIAINKLAMVNQQKNATGYALEYERLNKVTANYTKDESDVGQSIENTEKNRYKDNVVLNRSRVLLSRNNGSNYINASYVDLNAYKERNAFIVTQAPLQNTIEDFWIMVVDYEVGTIVMLNALEEHCPEYWPQNGCTTYGLVTVELQDSQTIGELISRRFSVNYNSTCVQVLHLQMLSWADKCVPDNPQSVLDLLNEVEQSQRQTKNAPVVVQCSNGVGRSGTFCAISSVVERVKQEQIIDVFQTVKRIRSNRPGAVETLVRIVFEFRVVFV
ncbi:hypothetical protein QZH41_014921 [Actinostola sp. cb2023]|nr:hypothetical protein QZH41_014921 [Actinostola sp. cb2023]